MMYKGFSSPLLGIFSIPTTVNACTTWRSRFRPLSRVPFFNAIRTSSGRDDRCFRPLSWGLSFNDGECGVDAEIRPAVFVPFLGDFLSMEISKLMNTDRLFKVFSSPFLGTFFQLDGVKKSHIMDVSFSSPFLGTFFQFQH